MKINSVYSLALSLILAFQILACNKPPSRVDAERGQASSSQSILSYQRGKAFDQATERKPASGYYPFYEAYRNRAANPLSGSFSDSKRCQSAAECSSGLCMNGFCAGRVPPPAWCADNGLFCSGDSQCCSKRCVGGQCEGDRNSFCSYVEQSCNTANNCCSGRCDGLDANRSGERVCLGNQNAECAIVGQVCEVQGPDQCCSGRCFSFNQNSKFGKCVGSTRDLGRSGEICSGAGSECLSGSCITIGANAGFGYCR